MILLHGGLGNADHWAHQVPALVDKFQVIAIDSRGQGRSTLPRPSSRYDAMADDVLAVMDKLKLEKAAIVGWSDGGEIALKLAIPHPERVAKLFVVRHQLRLQRLQVAQRPVAPTFSAYAAKCRTDYQKLSKTPKQFDGARRLRCCRSGATRWASRRTSCSRSRRRRWSPTAITTRSSCSTRSRRWRS